ncbi:hypothetical protein [Crossiella sp. NPDC003009]
MRKLLRSLGKFLAELAYGVHAGHAIRHGLPTPPSPEVRRRSPRGPRSTGTDRAAGP